MPHPTKRHPKSRKKRAAAHRGIKPTTTSPCPKCTQPKRPHHACAYCGTYKNKKA